MILAGIQALISYEGRENGKSVSVHKHYIGEVKMGNEVLSAGPFEELAELPFGLMILVSNKPHGVINCVSV